MKEILKKSKLACVLLSSADVDSNIKYRLLKYCLFVEYDDSILLFNVLTRQLVALSREEYELAVSGNVNTVSCLLIKDYFLVPETFDDENLKNQIINFMSIVQPEKGLKHFIIFPTLDCNARCFYCFEHSAKRVSMTKKIADDVSNFIVKNSNGKIKIQWFGGEPLYNIEAINIIADKLIDKSIEFESTMISNGYLFDKDIVKLAKNRWNLNKVQITLDGTENVYNKIKAYIYKDDNSPFLRVIENIHLLIDVGIKVIIRINMDRHNCDDLNSLVDFLYEQFKNKSDFLTIYAWLLYDNRGAKKTVRNEQDRHELTKKLLKLEERIQLYGFLQKAIPNNSLPKYACPADNPNSAVILPDGRLGKCDHHFDDELYGSIYDDTIDYQVISEWSKRRPPVSLCETCPISPECLIVKKCPDVGSFDCDFVEQNRRIVKIKRQIINAYKRHMGVKNNDI